MEKVIKITKKGEDDSNLNYWLSLSKIERLIELEKIRKEVNSRLYADRQRFQRVYTITKRV
jgi:hypothetical protein